MSAAEQHAQRFTPTVMQILIAVEGEFGIPVRDLLGPSRWRSIAMARHIAQFICRRLRSMSYPELRREFALKDHTSAIYACQKVEALIAADEDMRGRVLRAELEAIHAAQKAAHARGLQ